MKNKTKFILIGIICLIVAVGFAFLLVDGAKKPKEDIKGRIEILLGLLLGAGSLGVGINMFMKAGTYDKNDKYRGYDTEF